MEPTQSMEQAGGKRTPLFVRETWFPGQFFIFAVLFLIIMGYLLLMVVPRFEEIYVSIGSPLPFLTQFLVIASITAIRGLPIAVLLAVAILYYALRMDRARRASTDRPFWKWILLWLYLGGVFVVILTVFALYLPIFKIGDVIK